jgi:hypothetical protein
VGDHFRGICVVRILGCGTVVWVLKWVQTRGSYNARCLKSASMRNYLSLAERNIDDCAFHLI